MAVHCGGPGSLSDCVYGMAADLGYDNADNYNVIAFDQRGMGRSTPSFIIEQCDFEEEDEDARDFNDFTKATSILAAGEMWKKRAFKCWTYEGFRFEVEDEFTGDTLTYHFLEYSGTRQLAEDIERVRQLFGDQKLFIYGISHGTKVMGTFATIFPGSVNLMVLDGNDDSGSDNVVNAKDIAESNNNRIDYIIYSCTLLELESPVISYQLSEGNRDDYLALLQIVASSIEDGAKLCDAVEAGDEEEAIAIIDAFYETSGAQTRRQPDDIVDTPSKPTTEASYAYEARGSIPQDMVTAQDYTNGAYSDDLFVRTLMNLNEMYPGAGTQQPTGAVLQWYGALFFWPKNTPLPPIGNSLLSGIIAGQIYDPYTPTPYKWTLKMRERFPLTYLLSSQSVNHGLGSAADWGGLNPEGTDPCIINYQRYFKTGLVDFTDGQVCPAQNALATCGIASALQGSTCDRR